MERFQTSYNGKATYDRRLRNIDFRYLYRIKLLPTFSYISIVVSVCIGRFSHNRSHIRNELAHLDS